MKFLINFEIRLYTPTWLFINKISKISLESLLPIITLFCFNNSSNFSIKLKDNHFIEFCCFLLNLNMNEP